MTETQYDQFLAANPRFESFASFRDAMLSDSAKEHDGWSDFEWHEGLDESDFEIWFRERGIPYKVFHSQEFSAVAIDL